MLNYVKPSRNTTNTGDHLVRLCKAPYILKIQKLIIRSQKTQYGMLVVSTETTDIGSQTQTKSTNKMSMNAMNTTVYLVNYIHIINMRTSKNIRGIKLIHSIIAHK